MDETQDVGPVTSLEAMRSTGIATSTTAKPVGKVNTQMNGQTVKRHAPIRTTATKTIGAHTVKHSKPSKK